MAKLVHIMLLYAQVKLCKVMTKYDQLMKKLLMTIITSLHSFRNHFVPCNFTELNYKNVSLGLVYWSSQVLGSLEEIWKTSLSW